MDSSKHGLLAAVTLTCVVAMAPGEVRGQVQPLGEVLDCVDCSICTAEGGATGNKAYPGDATSVSDKGSGDHTNCVGTGNCTQQHPINAACPGFHQGLAAADLQALLDRTRRAVSTGELEKARLIASSSGAQIRYVPERDAIQVLGCRDRIIAHLPLRRAHNMADEL